MSRVKIVLAAVLLLGFGMQLNLHAQVPLCFEVKTERELRENVKAETGGDIRSVYFFHSLLSSTFFSQPEPVRLYFLVPLAPEHRYSNFSKETLFNHSPPRSL